MKLFDKILYLDNHLFAVVKPAGVATQPDFEEMAKAYLQAHFKKSGAVFLRPIHRLDKPVQGIVLFARTSKALSRLNEMMKKREIGKTYVAWVGGVLKKESATLKHNLVHGAFKAHEGPSGKEAILSYKALERRQGMCCVEINLETGRYHQIRAQFSLIGHPIIGDEKYGSNKSYPRGIALQHTRMEFAHPVGGKQIVLEMPPQFEWR